MEITGIRVAVDASLAKQGEREFNASLDSMVAKSSTVGQQIASGLRSGDRGLRDMAETARTVSGQIATSLGTIRYGFRGLIDSVLNFRTIFDAAIGGISLNAIVSAVSRIENIKIGLQGASGSAEKAGEMWDYLNRKGAELGFSVLQLGEKFVNLQAATAGTALEGQRAIKIFEGAAVAAKALGGGEERMERVLQAFTNIISQETVQGPMMIRMLARTAQLPDAMQVAARAYGVSVDEMIAKLREGTLNSETFVLRFATELGKRMPEAAAKAADSMDSWKARVGNALESLMENVGEGGFGKAMLQMLKDLAVELSSPTFQQAAAQLGGLLANALRAATTAFQFLGEHIGLVKVALVGLVAFEVLDFVANLAKNVLILAAAFGKATVAARGLEAAEGVTALGAVAAVALAEGGVMTSKGPLPLAHYAGGGIATTPQMAVFGEGSRPEAYIPLPDGRNVPVTIGMNMVREAAASPLFPSLPIPSLTDAYIPLPGGRKIPAKLTVSQPFPVRRYASGGIADSGAAIYGEAGPEAAIPLMAGAVPVAFTQTFAGPYSSSLQSGRGIDFVAMMQGMAIKKLQDSVSVLEQRAQVAPASHSAPTPIPVRSVTMPPPQPAHEAGGFHMSAAAMIAPLLMALPMLLSRRAPAMEKPVAAPQAVHAFAPREDIRASFEHSLDRVYGGAITDTMRERMQDFVAPHATRPIRYMAGGAENQVFDIGEDKVARFGWGETPPFPKIPEVLQPLDTTTIPGRFTESLMHGEIMPKADVESVGAAELRQMKQRMDQLGYHWDAHGGNIGSYQGQTRILDTGGMYQKARPESYLEDVIAHDRETRDEGEKHWGRIVRNASRGPAALEPEVGTHAFAPRAAAPMDVAGWFKQDKKKIAELQQAASQMIAGKSSPDVRSLRTLMEQTQSVLDPEKLLTLYRGVGPANALDALKHGGLAVNPLSSWSKEFDVASTFPIGGEGGGAVFKAKIPASRLAFTGKDAPAELKEMMGKGGGWEQVVMAPGGGRIKAQMVGATPDVAAADTGIHAFAQRAAFVVPGQPVPEKWPEHAAMRWSGGPDTGHWTSPVDLEERKVALHDEFLAEQKKAIEHENRAAGARQAWVKIRANRAAAAAEAAEKAKNLEEAAKPPDWLAWLAKNPPGEEGSLSSGKAAQQAYGEFVQRMQNKYLAGGQWAQKLNVAEEGERQQLAQAVRNAAPKVQPLAKPANWEDVAQKLASPGDPWQGSAGRRALAHADELWKKQQAEVQPLAAQAVEHEKHAAAARKAWVKRHANMAAAAEAAALPMLGPEPGAQGELFPGVLGKEFAASRPLGIQRPGPEPAEMQSLREAFMARVGARFQRGVATPVGEKAMKQLFEFAAPFMQEPPKFLNAGLEHAAYRIAPHTPKEQGMVLKVGFGPDTPVPDITPVLQPIAHQQFAGTRTFRDVPGTFHAAVMPWAETGLGGEAVRRMDEMMEDYGKKWDNHAGNIGRVAGKLKIIDAGFMRSNDEYVGDELDRVRNEARRRGWKREAFPGERGDSDTHAFAPRSLGTQLAATPLLRNPLPLQQTEIPDIAAALGEYTTKKLRLAPLDTATATPGRMISRALAMGTPELEHQLRQPESGVEWYTRDIGTMRSEFAKLHPETAQNRNLQGFVSAITASASLGNDSPSTARLTDEMYSQFKSTGGKVPLRRETGEAWGSAYPNSVREVLSNLQKVVDKTGSPEAAYQYMITKHPVGEMRELTGKQIAGRAEQERYGAYALSPKAGAFMLNMNDMPGEFTMDKWMTRQWRRWMGTSDTSKEAPTPPERRVATEAYTRLGERFGLPVRDAQAPLWNFEQTLYRKQGASITPQQSYGTAMRDYVAARLRERAEAEAVSFNPEEFGTHAFAPRVGPWVDPQHAYERDAHEREMAEAKAAAEAVSQHPLRDIGTEPAPMNRRLPGHIEYEPDPNSISQYMQLIAHGPGTPYLFDTANTTWNWNKDRSMLAIQQQMSAHPPFASHSERFEVPAENVREWTYASPNDSHWLRPRAGGFNPSGLAGLQFAPELGARMAAVHAETEGATFDPRTTRNLVGTQAWSVGVAPEVSQVMSRMPGPADFRAFAEKNRELFEKFENAQIGSWHDIETGMHHLDVVGLARSKEQALRTATDIGEKGIFNLKSLEYMPTGYTLPQRPPLLSTIGERLTQLQGGSYVSSTPISQKTDEDIHAFAARGGTSVAETLIRRLEEASLATAARTGMAPAPVTESMRGAARAFADAGMTEQVAASMPLRGMAIGGLKRPDFQGQWDDKLQEMRIRVDKTGADAIGAVAHELTHALDQGARQSRPELAAAADAEIAKVQNQATELMRSLFPNIRSDLGTRALGPRMSALIAERVGGPSQYAVETRDKHEYVAEAGRIMAYGSAAEKSQLTSRTPDLAAYAQTLITGTAPTPVARQQAVPPAMQRVMEVAAASPGLRGMVMPSQMATVEPTTAAEIAAMRAPRAVAPMPEMHALEELERAAAPMPGRMEMLGAHVSNLAMAAQMAAMPLMGVAPKAADLIFALSNLGMFVPMIPQMFESLRGILGVTRPATTVASDTIHSFAPRGVTPPQLETFAEAARQHGKAAQAAAEARSVTRRPGQVVPEVIEQALLSTPRVTGGRFSLPGGGTMGTPLLLTGEVDKTVGLFEHMGVRIRANWKALWQELKGDYGGFLSAATATKDALVGIWHSGAAAIKSAWHGMGKLLATELDDPALRRKISVGLANMVGLNKPTGVVGGLEKAALGAVGGAAAGEAAAAAGGVAKGLGAAGGAAGVLQGLLGGLAGTFGLIVGAVALLAGGLYLARNNQVLINGEAYKMSDIYVGAWMKIKSVASGVLSALGSAFKTLFDGAMRGVTAFLDAWFGEGKAEAWFGKMWEGFKGLFGGLAQAGRDAREEAERTRRQLSRILVDYGSAAYQFPTKSREELATEHPDFSKKQIEKIVSKEAELQATGMQGRTPQQMPGITGMEFTIPVPVLGSNQQRTFGVTTVETPEMAEARLRLSRIDRGQKELAILMSGPEQALPKDRQAPPKPWDTLMEELRTRVGVAQQQAKAALIGPEEVERIKMAGEAEKVIIQLQKEWDDAASQGKSVPKLQEQAEKIDEVRQSYAKLADAARQEKANATLTEFLDKLEAVKQSMAEVPTFEVTLPRTAEQYGIPGLQHGPQLVGGEVAPPEKIQVAALTPAITGYQNLSDAISHGAAAEAEFIKLMEEEARLRGKNVDEARIEEALRKEKGVDEALRAKEFTDDVRREKLKLDRETASVGTLSTVAFGSTADIRRAQAEKQVQQYEVEKKATPETPGYAEAHADLVRHYEDLDRASQAQQTLNQIVGQYDPQHQYREALAKIREAWNALPSGMRDSQEAVIAFQAAAMDAAEQYAQHMDDMLMRTKTFVGGAAAAFDEWGRAAVNAASAAKKEVDDLMGGLTAAFTAGIMGQTRMERDPKTGRERPVSEMGVLMKELAKTLQKDVVESFVKQNITGPLAEGLGKALGIVHPKQPKGTHDDPIYVADARQKPIEQDHAAHGPLAAIFAKIGGWIGGVLGKFGMGIPHRDPLTAASTATGLGKEDQGGWYNTGGQGGGIGATAEKVFGGGMLGHGVLGGLFGADTALPDGTEQKPYYVVLSTGPGGTTRGAAGTLAGNVVNAVGGLINRGQGAQGQESGGLPYTAGGAPTAIPGVVGAISDAGSLLSSQGGNEQAGGGGGTLGVIGGIVGTVGNVLGKVFGGGGGERSTGVLGNHPDGTMKNPFWVMLASPSAFGLGGKPGEGTKNANLPMGTHDNPMYVWMVNGGGGGGQGGSIADGLKSLTSLQGGGSADGSGGGGGGVLSSIGGFFSSIFKGIGGIFSGGAAEGGPVFPGKSYIVGERGPEKAVYRDGGTQMLGERGPHFFSPASPATIIPNERLGAVAETATWNQLLSAIHGGQSTMSMAEPWSWERSTASAFGSVPLGTSAQPLRVRGFAAGGTMSATSSSGGKPFEQWAPGGTKTTRDPSGQWIVTGYTRDHNPLWATFDHMVPTKQGGWAIPSGAFPKKLGGSGSAGLWSMDILPLVEMFGMALLSQFMKKLGGGLGPGGQTASQGSTAAGIPAATGVLSELNSLTALSAPKFGNGGIMTPFGAVPLRKYDTGGISRSPQASIFGEGSTPEAYVPLPDGRTIPVTVSGEGYSGRTEVHHHHYHNTTMNVQGVRDTDSFRKSAPQLAAEVNNAMRRYSRSTQ